MKILSGLRDLVRRVPEGEPRPCASCGTNVPGFHGDRSRRHDVLCGSPDCAAQYQADSLF